MLEPLNFHSERGEILLLIGSNSSLTAEVIVLTIGALRFRYFRFEKSLFAAHEPMHNAAKKEY
jgi:hypothetical protein